MDTLLKWDAYLKKTFSELRQKNPAATWRDLYAAIDEKRQAGNTSVPAGPQITPELIEKMRAREEAWLKYYNDNKPWAIEELKKGKAANYNPSEKAIYQKITKKYFSKEEDPDNRRSMHDIPTKINMELSSFPKSGKMIQPFKNADEYDLYSEAYRPFLSAASRNLGKRHFGPSGSRYVFNKNTASWVPHVWADPTIAQQMYMTGKSPAYAYKTNMFQNMYNKYNAAPPMRNEEESAEPNYSSLPLPQTQSEIGELTAAIRELTIQVRENNNLLRQTLKRRNQNAGRRRKTRSHSKK